MSAETVDDRELLAAEYALGTLDPVERDAATRLRTSDITFSRLVEVWELRFSALADRIPIEAPPDGTWGKIAAVIGDITSVGNVVVLRRSLSRWRTATIATGALAAALALFVLERDFLRAPLEPAGGAYFAAVNRGGDMPALVVRVDLATKLVTVRSVDAASPPGKSLELWYVATGQAPKSMGVLESGRKRMAMPSNMPVENTVFAVSVEPTGGSPTGAPTGPVIYKGQLVSE